MAGCWVQGEAPIYCYYTAFLPFQVLGPVRYLLLGPDIITCFTDNFTLHLNQFMLLFADTKAMKHQRCEPSVPLARSVVLKTTNN